MVDGTGWPSILICINKTGTGSYDHNYYYYYFQVLAAVADSSSQQMLIQK